MRHPIGFAFFLLLFSSAHAFDIGSMASSIGNNFGGKNSLSIGDNSTLSNAKTSSIFGATSSIQCPGIKIPNFGLNIGSILSSTGFNFGNCKVSAQDKNLECLNRKLSVARNPKNLLPTSSIESGLRTKIFTDSCDKTTALSGSFSSAASSGIDFMSRKFNNYRSCLDYGGGASCSTDAFLLPSSQSDTDIEVHGAASMITASRTKRFSSSTGDEKAASKKIESSCADTACAGNAMQQSTEDKESAALEAIAKTSAGEYQLLKQATSQPYYFFDASEEPLNVIPIQYRNKFKSGSIRTNAAEAILASLSSDQNSVEKELASAIYNKNKISSSPIMSSLINDYVKDVADTGKKNSGFVGGIISNGMGNAQ